MALIVLLHESDIITAMLCAMATVTTLKQKVYNIYLAMP